MITREAQNKDLAAICRLLDSAGLPTAGVADHLSRFIVMMDEDSLVGTVGLEVYGDRALLRSLAVHPAHRRQGRGEALFQAVMSLAGRLKIREVYLLTETAEPFFRRRGFTRIDRAEVPAEVRTSVEFVSCCPASAACMRRGV
jgi:amino-acid N-acetyltransferase